MGPRRRFPLRPGISLSVLREGPIPHAVHGLLEYAAGAALIVLPLLIGYDSGAAKAASIVAGVLLLFVAATTAGPTSLVNSLPVAVHILLDYVLVAALIAAPFLFGFSDETEPTAVFIALGVLHMLVSIGTRFTKPPPGEEGGRGRGEIAAPDAEPAPSGRAADRESR